MTSKTEFRSFIWLLLLCFAAFFASRFPQFIDPFLRHDDYPTLLGEPRLAFTKTLTEGRWLNYWWTIRPVLWPSPVNFALYASAWIIMCASIPFAVLKPESPFWYKAALALLVLFAIPAYQISQWFTTIIPGVWTLAVHSLAVAFLSQRAALFSLALLTPLSFMAYPTYPFIMLAISLLSYRHPHDIRHVAGTLTLFVMAFVAGMLLVNLLNYIVHGHFGVQIAEWRSPTPAGTMEEAWSNLTKFSQNYLGDISTIGLGNFYFGLFQLMAFGFSWLLLLVLRPWNALLIFIVTGLGCMAVIVKLAQDGVYIPLRAFDWLWVLYVITLVLLALELAGKTRVGPGMLRILIVTVIFTHAFRIGFEQHRHISVWQSSTRDLAMSLPSDTEQVFVYGSFRAIQGAVGVGIQGPRGLQGRLTYLTGGKVIICDDTPAECDGITPAFDLNARAASPTIVSEDGTAFVLLPEENAKD